MEYSPVKWEKQTEEENTGGSRMNMDGSSVACLEPQGEDDEIKIEIEIEKHYWICSALPCRDGVFGWDGIDDAAASVGRSESDDCYQYLIDGASRWVS